MVDDEDEVRGLLLKYQPIAEAVAPMVELIRNEPAVTEHVIRLAMILGIHAAHNRVRRDAKQEMVGTIHDWIGFKRG